MVKDGQVDFHCCIANGICMVNTMRRQGRVVTKDIIVSMVLSTVEETYTTSKPDEGTLLQFHLRLEHLSILLNVWLKIQILESSSLIMTVSIPFSALKVKGREVLSL